MLSSPHRHARVALAVGTLLASALASVVASAGAVQGAAGAAATRTATSVRGTHASELTPRIAAVAKRALSANPTQGVSSHTVSPSSNVWIPGTFPGGWVNTSSCWSPGNCVAVGSEAYGDNGPPVAFLVVNGVVHTAPAPPISGGFGLQADALSCTSATFCALTNGADDTTAPIDFFNGSSWQVQSTPALLSGVELGNISCSSPTFCVASGWAYSKNSDGSNVAVPQLLTYQGTAWTQATLPALPASTSPDVPTSASCAGSFCMIGPVAQAASGAEWMAVLSGGVWTDSKITSVTPSGTGAYAVGAVACVGAGTCIVSVLPPASSVAGTTLYQSGKWSPLSALADVPAPSEPSLGTPAGVPSLSCLSTTECVASVLYENYSGLEQFDGTTWTAVSGTLSTISSSDADWGSVSCPTAGSCFVTSQDGFAYSSPPLSTSVSIAAIQTGPEDVTAVATVSWPELSSGSPAPAALTYYFDGHPINGCTDIPFSNPHDSPYIDPGCDVLFYQDDPYSFSASVSSDEFYVGSSSSSVGGKVADGYWLADGDGQIFAYGSAQSYGDLEGTDLAQPIVGMSLTPDQYGYWLVGTDGGIFTFGDAEFYGSTGNIHLNKPIVGMASTPEGAGYWLVASDGGVFAFGDAGYHGSTGNIHLNKPIVGMAATPDGAGYWLVASDGGIFAFGDADYFGSTGNIHLNKPIVGMASTPDGGGYWLVASDGGVFTFGDAGYYGSTGNIHLNRPIVGLASTGDGGGYWMVASDGGIFTFGDATFDGSAGATANPALAVTVQ